MILADLEEKLKKKGRCGTILGNSKIYSLAYADEVVLLADNETKMNLMMKIFEEYVGAKDLTVNVEKTKVMCFRRRNTVIDYVWKIKRQTVESVEEFCYLRFWLEAGEENELQVKKKFNVRVM
ncbi:uncharacterized protein LOC117181545 [Belonocnema kinseyi]|uniref:uncharacterized protein LOC117181545 n=1 Tax=Belonocnema kinseyi TaxID=2817044 RepID=UPI00143D9F18|nr:uncharacterized protein LOC117181545 [Belonocnema kinseyi]